MSSLETEATSETLTECERCPIALMWGRKSNPEPHLNEIMHSTGIYLVSALHRDLPNPFQSEISAFNVNDNSEEKPRHSLALSAMLQTN